jgi:hypothetical protein
MPKFSYILKSGFKEMDFDQVTRMLENAWWSPGIKEEEINIIHHQTGHYDLFFQ